MNSSVFNRNKSRSDFFEKINILFFILIRSVSEIFWEEYSNENIKNAETQRLNAVQLRNVIDGILKKLVADIKQAVERTRRSFDRRIYESKQAKQKLEDQLRDVNK